MFVAGQVVAETVAPTALGDERVDDTLRAVPGGDDLGALCTSQIFDTDVNVQPTIPVHLGASVAERGNHFGDLVKSATVDREHWRNNFPAVLDTTVAVRGDRTVALDLPLGVLVFGGDYFTARLARCGTSSVRRMIRKHVDVLDVERLGNYLAGEQFRDALEFDLDTERAVQNSVLADRLRDGGGASEAAQRGVPSSL